MMLKCGDCLEELKKLPEASVDSLVTDPPAGISMMGKEWDSDKGGRDQWIAWMREVMQECLRVLKPGAHAFVWAIPRTSHWTATALEDAGFEIRDVVTHIFGSGFPKSLDVSKAIDKAAGSQREVIGHQDYSAPDIRGNSYDQSHVSDRERLGVPITAPSTPEAKQWQGWGTALKPSVERWLMVRKPKETLELESETTSAGWSEDIILIRKPLSERTVAANVLAYGTGAINIDASRISLDSKVNLSAKQKNFDAMGFGGNSETSEASTYNAQGRFPANLVLSHSVGCVEVGTKKVGSGEKKQSGYRAPRNNPVYASSPNTTRHSPDNYGTETVSAWECAEGCAVAMLDEQSLAAGMHGAGKARDKGNFSKSGLFKSADTGVGHRLGDSGGASRFFYVAKASKRERNAGCERLPEIEANTCTGATRPNKPARLGADPHKKTALASNHHPTVKPLKLMTYLITMITPPGGTVLDPFMGSGSTGVAAKAAYFNFIGFEKDPQYLEIAEKRIQATIQFRKEKLL